MQIQNKRLRNAISKAITLIFSKINQIIPKQKKQVLFYTNTGVKDNLKAVLNCMAADPSSEYHLICSCNDATGVPPGVHIIGNIAGLFCFLRSSFIFYYNGKLPIKPKRGQTVVNLWHGIPLKKIGRMLDPEMDLDFATHYLAPSPYTGELMQQAFGCDAQKILIGGLPRCDLLFEAPDAQTACALLGHPECSRLIAWMPTFRNAAVSSICDSNLKELSKTGLPLLHDADALAQCNELCRKQGALLWIKLHPSETGFPQNAEYSNLLIQTDASFLQLGIDFYRLLGSCDALITDYSSVYFDFLLLDRPIGFTVEDIDSYAGNRGFTAEDPLAQMPGPILTESGHLYAFLNAVLSGGDSFAEKRRVIRTQYCGETDPNAAKSLLQKINLKGA